MSVTVRYAFDCGGCPAKARGESRVVTREFVSITGRHYGFGSYRINTPTPDPPEGWVDFDTFTGCCYCPECWKDILKGKLE